MDVPQVRYATTADGLAIAYQQWGDGDRDFVWIPGTASHLEVFWQIPVMVHQFRRLGAHLRVTFLDKRGTGPSDRSLGTGTIEDRGSDVRAVMDDAGIERAVIAGFSESGALAMWFAAKHPDRVERLLLVAAAPVGRAPPEFLEFVDTEWGTGRVLQSVWFRGAPDGSLQELARYERSMATPRAISTLLRHNLTLDARSLASSIRVPTRVIHSHDDPVVPFSAAEWLSSHIADAELIAIEGEFHASSDPDEMDRYLDPMIDFAAVGDTHAHHPADRVLALVLFTDIVESTDVAARLGDERWSARLDSFDHACRAAVERDGGSLVKFTGDGLIARFDGPSAGVAAALELRDLATGFGLSTRSGLHFGEIELRDDDIGGLGVVLAARVMEAAADDEVWVSSTVSGLTVGSSLQFEDRGAHSLKGIPGEWNLSAVSPS